MLDNARPCRAAADAATISNPVIAEADAIRIALRWFPWYSQHATELDRAAEKSLRDTLAANGFIHEREAGHA